MVAEGRIHQCFVNGHSSSRHWWKKERKKETHKTPYSCSVLLRNINYTFLPCEQILIDSICCIKHFFWQMPSQEWSSMCKINNASEREGPGCRKGLSLSNTFACLLAFPSTSKQESQGFHAAGALNHIKQGYRSGCPQTFFLPARCTVRMWQIQWVSHLRVRLTS